MIEVDDFVALYFPQGQPPILSRLKDPTLHSTWSPASVPAVKAQPWVFNYEDKNIADNPVHETVADLLIGLDQCVAACCRALILVTIVRSQWHTQRKPLFCFAVFIV
jgi:hypothetical protein